MASHPIYQFYAELQDYEPKIWRQFQVMNNITMARLGYILMTLYEMQASHLFCFDVPVEDNFRVCVGGELGSPANQAAMEIFAEEPEMSVLHIALGNDEDFEEPEGLFMEAAETLVRNVVNYPGETMTFTYDFGDGWEVLLRLEEVINDKTLPGRELPRVLAGEGFGIIEDCGGPGGLEDLAAAFKKKKGHKYQELREWLGQDDLDLAAFDLEDMNFRLKKVPRIYADIYENDLEPTEYSMKLLERRQ